MIVSKKELRENYMSDETTIAEDQQATRLDYANVRIAELQMRLEEFMKEKEQMEFNYKILHKQYDFIALMYERVIAGILNGLR